MGTTALDLILRAGPKPVPPLPGPLLWFDASRLRGYSTGDLVGTVPDLSGNGWSAVQATAAARPTYQPNVLNGFPVLRFDGSNDIVSTPSLALAGAGMAMFAVLAQRVSQAGNIRAIGWNGTNVAKIQVGASHGNIIAAYTSGGAITGSATPMAQGAFGVCTFYFDNVRLYSYVNGANSANAAASGGVTTAPCDIGGGAGSFLDGDVAEVIVYDRVLTTAERQTVERALGAKYGITVA